MSHDLKTIDNINKELIKFKNLTNLNYGDHKKISEYLGLNYPTYRNLRSGNSNTRISLNRLRAMNEKLIALKADGLKLLLQELLNGKKQEAVQLDIEDWLNRNEANCNSNYIM